VNLPDDTPSRNTRQDAIIGIFVGCLCLFFLQIGYCLTKRDLDDAQGEASAYRQRAAALCGMVHSRLTLAQVYTPAADLHRIEIQSALTETAPYVRFCGVSEEIRLQMREAALGTPSARELEDAVWAASKALSAARRDHWPIEAR
jgi:hypothetical protein